MVLRGGSASATHISTVSDLPIIFRVSFQRVPSPYGPSVNSWTDSTPLSVVAEPGMSVMTVQTFSGDAWMCWLRLMLWSMGSSLAADPRNRQNPGVPGDLN
ncbi:hypothetical protein GCM10011577_32740 [Pseudarthrobacter polychromogenes]|uniref:Uncharacterized protein n=1 Tax=Pseudarthrobacter polychromogenes TaxID=1676 RepID=A0ABQ1XXU3_9MICC|nr:hypothetical protein GCM10011577_32740 [Pseudarthrobacter polychromogenes]